ncbi:MAG: PD-(D/E)XK nuclease family protein [Paralcaligenes sp.]
MADFSQVLNQFAPQLGRAWQRLVDGALCDVSEVALDFWVRRFKRMLQELGFPGESVLDSAAYQTMQALEDVLSRLSRQAAVLGELDFHMAVSLFRQLALETSFQPQRDPAARLDVLGFLEAEGGAWDGVWVLGLSDEILPAAPKPNPFIAPAALRRANAPRATAERELQWAHDMYAALCCCAPQVWVSHAQFEGERLLRPSPFIANLVAQECAPQLAQCAPAMLESLLDEHGPALEVGGVTKGGIGVIDTQARNPMWAFVKYRLGASQLEGYAQAADQNARGIFLHRAVEIVWSMVGDQSRLHSLHVDGCLQELVHQSVQQAAQEHLGHYGNVLKRLEVERGCSVVNSWLQLEMAREPFRVREIEHGYQWSFGALELNLRVDRIDELSDGRLAIIDYKSGSGRLDPRASWVRQRPVDVQLPLYAAVLAGTDAMVAALILARLHAKQIEVKGLADGDYGFEGLDSPADWPDFSGYSWVQVLQQWRVAIERLAQEYSAGVANNRVAQPMDLNYCDVLPFLRLDEEARHDN